MIAKILGIIEVSVIFVVMICLFRFVNAIPLVPEVSTFFDGHLFPGYAALLIVSLSIYIFRVHTKSQTHPSKKLKYQLDIAAYGLFPIFTLSVLLSWIDWRQWVGAIVISIVEIGLIFWFVRAVKDKPALQNIGGVGGFLLFPIASHTTTKIASIVVDIMYYYLFVALGEEILFRGYIQSRLNSVFGRSKQLFEIRWGWGLMIASALFGLWHLSWETSMLEWPHVLWTLFAGLLLGSVREKSESVIAPALLHGMMNYGPQAILFSLFWN